MAKEIKNIGASVRARLLQVSKTSGQTFDLVLTRFALDPLRLGAAPLPAQPVTPRRPLRAEGRDAVMTRTAARATLIC